MAHLTFTQEQIKSVLPTIIKSDVVPMITGAAGCGKSSIVRAVADELNLKLIDIRVSQLMP